MFSRLARSNASRVSALTKTSKPILQMHPTSITIFPPWHIIINTPTVTMSSCSSPRVHEQQRRRQGDTENEYQAAYTPSTGAFALAVLTSGFIGFGLAYSDFFNSRAHSRENGIGYGSPEDFRKAIQELQEVFGPEEGLLGQLITTNPDVLHDHGYSPLIHHEGELCLSLVINIGGASVDQLTGMAHSVVVFPRSTEDVVKIVKIATKYRMPVIPYSGATNLEGHTRGVS